MVRWLDRLRTRSPADPRRKPPSSPESAPVERTSPGLAVLFEALQKDPAHGLLDLGLANNEHLAFFGRLAQQVRFAGLVPVPPSGEDFIAALDSIPPDRERPFDVVLAWDVFDRIGPDERTALVRRLDHVTAPGARLYAVVESTDASTTRPLRHTIVEVGRVRQEPVGPSEPARPQLLPLQVERMLAPFEIIHAFSLRAGLREYVALKP
jgi:hypothetical protein